MRDPMFSLEGRIALVTGATQGLGLEIASRFASAGSHVFLNGRDAETCETVAACLRQKGYQATALAFDVADAQASTDAIAYLGGAFGRLDILVNNVGRRLREPLQAISPEKFSDHLHTNLTSAFRLSRLAIPLMAFHGWGRIIMMTSIVAHLGRAGDVAYIAAKGGLTSLMRALAVEVGSQGITCNAIAPGSFATETNRVSMTEDVRTRLASRTPLCRVGEPIEIAGPALFLASDAASFVTGQVLHVDGGYSTAF